MKPYLERLFSEIINRYGKITLNNLFDYVLVNYNKYFFLCGQNPEIITVRKGDCTAEICRELYMKLLNDGVEIICRNRELVIVRKQKGE